jgi:hypothetical protein
VRRESEEQQTVVRAQAGTQFACVLVGTNLGPGLRRDDMHEVAIQKRFMIYLRCPIDGQFRAKVAEDVRE